MSKTRERGKERGRGKESPVEMPRSGQSPEINLREELETAKGATARVGQASVKRVELAGGDVSDVRDAKAAATEFVENIETTSDDFLKQNISELSRIIGAQSEEVKKERLKVSAELREKAQKIQDVLAATGSSASRSDLAKAGFLKAHDDLNRIISEIGSVDELLAGGEPLDKKEKNANELIGKMRAVIDSFGSKIEMSEATSVKVALSPEAEKLLVSVDKGMPAFVSANLKRIIRENIPDITEEDLKTKSPQDLIRLLKDKKEKLAAGTEPAVSMSPGVEMGAIDAETEKILSDYDAAQKRVRDKIGATSNLIWITSGLTNENIDMDARAKYLKQTYEPFWLRRNKLADRFSRVGSIANPYGRLQEAKALMSSIEEMEAEADKIKKFLETEPFLKRAMAEQEKTTALEQPADINEKEIEKEVLAIPEAERHNLWRGMAGMGFAVQEFKGWAIGRAVRLARKAGSGDKESQRFVDRFLDSAAETFEKTQKDAKKKREELYEKGGLIRGAVGIGTGVGNITMWSRMLLGYGFPPATWVMRGAMAIGRSAEVLKNARFKSHKLIESTRMDEDRAYEEAMAIYEKAQAKGGIEIGAADLQKAYRERLPAQILELLEKEGPRGIAQKIAQKHMLWSARKIAEKIKHIDSNPISSQKEKERDKEKLLRKQESLLADLDHFVTKSGMVDMVAYASRLTQVYGKRISTIMAVETLLEGVIHLANISHGADLNEAPKMAHGAAEHESVAHTEAAGVHAPAQHPLEAIHKGDFENSGYEGKTLETIHKGGFEGDDYGSKPLEQIHNANFENSEWGYGNGIIEIHHGGNAWNGIKAYLQENKLIEGLTDRQRDYVIASIEKNINDLSDADFAKTGFSGRDVDLVYEGQKLDLSQVLGDRDKMDAILERAGHLGEVAPPEGVAVAETTTHVPGVEEHVTEHAASAVGDHADLADASGEDLHSETQSAAENLAADTATSEDPAVRLWEMRHPGEIAPDSVLRKAHELLAHGVPLENNPLFVEESLSRVEGRLKDIFGSVGSRSSEWNAFKEYSAAEVLNMPESRLHGHLSSQVQDYARELMEKTGLEPEVRGRRMESLGHFIIRAEAGSLSMDLGGGSMIDLDSAPGLYQETDSDYVFSTKTPTYFEQEPIPEMPPRPIGGAGFRYNHVPGFNPDHHPFFRPHHRGFWGGWRWNPFSRHR